MAAVCLEWSLVTGQNMREQQAKPVLRFTLQYQRRLWGPRHWEFHSNHTSPHLFARFLVAASWFCAGLGWKCTCAASSANTYVQFSLFLIIKIDSMWRMHKTETLNGKYENPPDTLDFCCLHLQRGLTEQRRSTEDLWTADMVLEWRSIDKLNKHPQQRDRKSRREERMIRTEGLKKSVGWGEIVSLGRKRSACDNTHEARVRVQQKGFTDWKIYTLVPMRDITWLMAVQIHLLLSLWRRAIRGQKVVVRLPLLC